MDYLHGHFNMKQVASTSQISSAASSLCPPAPARLAHSLFLEDGAVGEGDLESAIQIWDDERHFFHAPG